MRWSTLLPALAWLGTCAHLAHARAPPPPPRDYDRHDYYAVHLRPDINPTDLAAHLGLHYDGPLGELQDHHIFRAGSRQHEYDHIHQAISDLRRRRRKREVGADAASPLDAVLLSRKQELHKRFPLVKRQVGSGTSDLPADAEVERGKQIAERLGIADPTYHEQWHLFNPVQLGHDLNVTGVWEQGITGNGSRTCIVDDGLDLDSDDLHDNYFAAGSYDFNDPGPDPKPRLSDDQHGTRCAGEVGAVRNDVCGVGVAYDSKVAGVRILSKVISNADEAAAMNYAYQENQIFSCSWGPPDDGRSMEAPDVLIQRAMVNGVQQGRGGRGSIYVFAIGNGAASDDNCNFDGYTNSIYSVSVGGIDRRGLHPYYSEACSAQLVVTYSSGSGDAIHTTDVGKNKCSATHGGTSAAGPLVAGIFALALQANPALTWRDIQYVTVMSAVRLEDQGDDWQMNTAIGREFSHQFGYGKADAWALVELAKTWVNVKPQAWLFSPWLHVKHAIPQGEQGLTSTFTVTKEMLAEANVARLEHVTVTMNVEHTRRGDLSVELVSPSGMVSYLATHRRNDNAPAGYRDWTFMSVAHWGESGEGVWTVVVKDTKVDDHNGTFIDYRMKFYGEAVDADKTTLLPLPNAHDDDDHDVEDEEPVATVTASVGTTSVSLPTETGAPPGNPDDHQDRPVATKVSTATTSTPTATSPPSAEDEVEPPKQTESSTPFLPHPFPSFGVSKTTQIWIYGAITLILIFLAGLGGWTLFVRRRRRRRGWHGGDRDEYDFELVEHEDESDEGEGREFGEQALGEGKKHGRRGGKGGRKRRAGELYDAFAEGSDGSDVFEVGSDEEEDEEEEEASEDGEGSGSAESASGRIKEGERYRDREG